MNFGQIDIYNNIFSFINENDISIKYNPFECIEMNKNYSFMNNNHEIPIMIGSKFDKYDSPLDMKGYFIVDGICKIINNIKVRESLNYGYNKCFLSDKREIIIKSMFEILCNRSTWSLPLNIFDFVKYSKCPEKLNSHLLFLPLGEHKVNEIDGLILCYTFDCWLKFRTPQYKWRLTTPGETIFECLESKQNPIDCLRKNTWKKCIYVISQDMNHFNIIGDRQAVSRVTIISNREIIKMNKRRVENDDMYKICPVQTPDGALTGTITYLCSDTKVTTRLSTVVIKPGSKHIFINGEYKGIGYVDKGDYDIIEEDHIMYVFNVYGRIIPGKSLVSMTATLLPYMKHNAAIRSMFSCTMLKQAILSKNKYNLFDTKYLLGDDNIKLEVGIMPWYGYNIEDGIVISNSATQKYRYHKIKIYKDFGFVIIRKYVNINTRVSKGTLLYKKFEPEEVRTIKNIYAEDDGIVTELYYEQSFIKIVVTKEDIPKIGDKMTSLHGQKGVISLIETNMPYYYKDGIKVYLELLVNPHAFPSRMTHGQIKEMGEKEEIVYINDKPTKNKIIVGKCRYLTLRHQVDDKFQSRDIGKLDPITKQPIAGKKVGGGLRFGQMEKEILIAIGAYDTIKDIWGIDKIKVWICPDTGIIEPNCKCKILINSHRFFTIILGYMRVLGYDIKLFPNNTYTIDMDPPEFPKTDNINFGDLNPLDIRIYQNSVILPICLRSPKIQWMYNTHLTKGLNKEILKLIKSKKGVYHNLFEGHRVNNCIRSVITPNPNLPIDVVEIPLNANIQLLYGLLNRQPSLNIDSIKLVKLIKSNKNTISFNPLLCSLFNADFDGDEMNIYGIDKVNIHEFGPIVPTKTQDYILGDLKEVTENGLTANKMGIKLMIEKKSKGKEFNYSHIYEQIGEVIINKKVEGFINGCYEKGLNEEEWYLSCKAARESIASIALNTPISGYLESLCNQAYL